MKQRNSKQRCEVKTALTHLPADAEDHARRQKDRQGDGDAKGDLDGQLPLLFLLLRLQKVFGPVVPVVAPLLARGHLAPATGRWVPNGERKAQGDVVGVKAVWVEDGANLCPDAYPAAPGGVGAGEEGRLEDEDEGGEGLGDAHDGGWKVR